METILSRKLMNIIRKNGPDGRQYTHTLRTISINGDKRGCSGFIQNPENGATIYVTTEQFAGVRLPFMWRYARNVRDYQGYQNHFERTLDELAKAINKALNTPVSETKECRI